MEQLQIIYKGNMFKVTPVITDNHSQFIAHLATGDVTVEMVVKDDPNKTKSWQEVGKGETDLANELGELIENAEQNNFYT